MRKAHIALAVLLVTFALTGLYPAAGQSEVAAPGPETASDADAGATPRAAGTNMAMTVASHEAYVSGSFRAAMLETDLTTNRTAPGRARTLATFGDRLEARLESLRQRRATTVRRYRSGAIDRDTYRYRMARIQAAARVVEALSTTAGSEVTALPNGTGTERLDRSRFRGYAREGDSISRTASRQLGDRRSTAEAETDSSDELVIVGEEDSSGGGTPADTDAGTDPGADDRTDATETPVPSPPTETAPEENHTGDTPTEPGRNTTERHGRDRNGTRDADVNPWYPRGEYGDWGDGHEWRSDPDGTDAYRDDWHDYWGYDEEAPTGWGDADHRFDGWNGSDADTDDSTDWNSDGHHFDGDSHDFDGDSHDFDGDGFDGDDRHFDGDDHHLDGDGDGWNGGSNSTATPETGTDEDSREPDRREDASETTAESGDDADSEDGWSRDPDDEDAWSDDSGETDAWNDGSSDADGWGGESGDGDGLTDSSGDSDGWTDGSGDADGWNDSSHDGDWGDGSSDGDNWGDDDAWDDDSSDGGDWGDGSGDDDNWGDGSRDSEWSDDSSDGHEWDGDGGDEADWQHGSGDGWENESGDGWGY